MVDKYRQRQFDKEARVCEGRALKWHTNEALIRRIRSSEANEDAYMGVTENAVCT